MDGEKLGEDVPLGTDSSGAKPLSKAEADLRALGPGALTLPETGGYTRGDVANIVVASGALILLLAAVGAFALWRRRRPG